MKEKISILGSLRKDVKKSTSYTCGGRPFTDLEDAMTTAIYEGVEGYFSDPGKMPTYQGCQSNVDTGHALLLWLVAYKDRIHEFYHNLDEIEHGDQEQEVCSLCQGTGFSLSAEHKCPSCEGEGFNYK